MAFVHDERYARAIAECCGYPTLDHAGRTLHRIGGVWCNYPFSEYGFPAGTIDDEFLDGAPRPYRFKVEARLDEEEPPFVEREPHLLGKLARLALPPGPSEEELERSRAHQIRKALKKARRAGWTAESGPVTRGWLDEFYPRYTRYVQRRHGSPPLGRGHFDAMQRHFADDMVASRVRRGSATGAWLLGYVDPEGRSCQITDIVTEPEHLADRVADLAHAELIHYARRRGLVAFDFGIARYPGQEFYKRKWGCDFRASYSVASDPTDRPADPEAGIYPVVRAVWRRLPHVVHARLGPVLRRRLGV